MYEQSSFNLQGGYMQIAQGNPDVIGLFLERVINSDALKGFGYKISKTPTTMETRVLTPVSSLPVLLSDMLEIAKFCRVNSLFTNENFPINCNGNVSIPFLHRFGYDVSSEDALVQLHKLGLRPATLAETLLLRVVRIGWKRIHPVICLNPNHRFFYNDRRYVPAMFYGETVVVDWISVLGMENGTRIGLLQLCVTS